MDPSQVKDARSRGELVSNFLQGVASPLQYMLELAPTVGCSALTSVLVLSVKLVMDIALPSLHAR